MHNMHGLEIDHARNLAGFWLSSRPTFLDLDTLGALVYTLGPAARWTSGSSRGHLLPALHHPDHGRMLAARVISGASPTQRVGYRDGDRFNLTRRNLVLSEDGRPVRRGQPLPVLVYPEAASPRS